MNCVLNTKQLLLLLITFISLSSQAQTGTKYIVVDQFGYLPESRKIAVIRNPVTGYDASESFAPGATYAVVNVSTGAQAFAGAPVQWNSGATDASSGDKCWWFDFSAVTTPGNYYILDVAKDARSYEFEIGNSIYNDVLRRAVRTFFYQRAGFAKEAAFAGAAWADGASHIGAKQDKAARQYNKKTDATTEKDVSGGWYDAGDYNKYSNWTANYIVDFMRAYVENPEIWGDNYNIPESGNDIPDLLDEAKWGIDHLLRMQNANGSVLSIVGLSHGSPPSSANGESLYGVASTSATLNAAAAFAIASTVYASIGMDQFSDNLMTAATKAWDWADANPDSLFYNNDGASGTSGLGAGQQETDNYGRLVAKMEAACFLFELTGETKYKDFFDANYTKIHLIEWTYAYPFETTNQEILLHYTKIAGATPAVVTAIKTVYKNAMNGSDNFPAYTSGKDPYNAYIKDYTWGSNSTKGAQGLMFTDMIQYGIDAANDGDFKKAAEGYIHYLHGVNPLSLVYLSNMNAYGADNSVKEFYHSWFTNGSAKWDRVGTSTYGPAPGFVTGGPNPSYDVDGCCATSSCGGSNAACTSENLSPPKGQPAQKSYKDFNTSWPVNSWSVTENSNGYQLNYIRLLSKFVTSSEIVTGVEDERDKTPTVFPNPTSGTFTVTSGTAVRFEATLVNSLGIALRTQTGVQQSTFDISHQPTGIYFIVFRQNNIQRVLKVAKY
jgi:endoglucanase